MKRSCPRNAVWVGIALSLALASRAPADMISITAFKDNTLIEEPNGLLSSGGEDGIFAGRVGTSGMNGIRRAVLAFDLAPIPSGSTITSVQLRLRLDRATALSGTQTMTLHKLLGDWGEGTANDLTGGGGGGALAGIGDATWLHQSFNTDAWTTPGGDFNSTASASLGVNTTPGIKTFPTTPQLVADVQGWLNEADTNFGFLIRGNETIARTARKFASRESLTITSRPMLVVQYTRPSRMPGDIDDDGDVDRDDAVIMAAHWGQSAAATADHGDFTSDGRVGQADLAVLQHNFGKPKPVSAAGNPPVPEPATWMFVAAVATVVARRSWPRRMAA
jgi:hypothetical protein